MNTERKIIPNGEPQIVAEGKIGALVFFPVLVDSGSGHVEKTFEKFVRPPGTRIIAVKDNKIFLQKEYRLETKNGADWRLPGGKVMDSFAEYKQYMGKEVPENMILKAGLQELQQESHLTATEMSVYKKSACGAIVEWDLYYIVARGITDDITNTHNEGEEIVDGKWFSFDEVKEMCANGSIDEDRTVATLYQFMK